METNAVSADHPPSELSNSVNSSSTGEGGSVEPPQATATLTASTPRMRKDTVVTLLWCAWTDLIDEAVGIDESVPEDHILPCGSKISGMLLQLGP